MAKANFKILFHLENEQIEIVEVKKYGITSDDVSKVYHWLLYDKKNDMLTPLVFETMKSETNKEYRKFEDSSLVFDTKQGKFTEKGKAQDLKYLNPEAPISDTLKDAVEDYLLMLNFRG